MAEKNWCWQDLNPSPFPPQFKVLTTRQLLCPQLNSDFILFKALRNRVNDIPARNEHHQDVEETKAFDQCVALDLDVVERIDGPLKHQAGYNRYELYWFSVVVWYLLS